MTFCGASSGRAGHIDFVSEVMALIFDMIRVVECTYTEVVE